MKHPFLERVKDSGITVRTYQSTAISRYTQGPWKDGVKPCIVGTGETRKAKAKIYLIRIFTPERMADLPSIMRHYLIPIHAIHSNQSSDSWVKKYDTYQEHLHTSPSWAEGADHWVLALACEVEDGAMLRRCQRSPTDSPVDGSHYFIDRTIMKKFEDLCDARDKEWSKKPRQERENGLIQLSEWNTRPDLKKRRYARRGAPVEDTTPDLVAAEMQAFQSKPDLGKLGDTVSIKSKMPSGASRFRKFFTRHVVGGGWGSG
ncbi:hypothetical protein FIBSPDRAFT_863332 [Athelia psychrophila]|uniref:Uncharacterized protein n=1 Tax=Athelia psychrophila TaxID=1759441 RepID=A0A166HE69_9AGAM|nr:hypothetical protein FIBSPDRAFT_863332 [Fibularhizoctonia sp. CBS 109695]